MVSLAAGGLSGGDICWDKDQSPHGASAGGCGELGGGWAPGFPFFPVPPDVSHPLEPGAEPDWVPEAAPGGMVELPRLSRWL